MPEEKELTIEEMKSLVSLATLLPALLEKITAINKEISELKASFVDIKNKFNTNTTAVMNYKESIDTFLQKQPDSSSLKKEIGEIKNLIKALDMKLNMEISPINPLPQPSTPPKKKEAKPKDEEEEQIEVIVDKILANSGGRKTRSLTLIDVKNGFKVNDDMAAKVLKWFEDRKMYNSKLHMLTFPRR